MSKKPLYGRAIYATLWVALLVIITIAGWTPARGGGDGTNVLALQTNVLALQNYGNFGFCSKNANVSYETLVRDSALPMGSAIDNGSFTSSKAHFDFGTTDIMVLSAMAGDSSNGDDSNAPRKPTGKQPATAEQIEAARVEDERRAREDAERIESERVRRETDEYVANHERELAAMSEAERRAYARGMEMLASNDERVAAAFARQQEREAEEEASRREAMALVREQELQETARLAAERQQAEEQAQRSGNIDDFKRVFEMDQLRMGYRMGHLTEISRIDAQLDALKREHDAMTARLAEVRQGQAKLLDLREQRVRAMNDGRPMEETSAIQADAMDVESSDSNAFKRVRERTPSQDQPEPRKKARVELDSERQKAGSSSKKSTVDVPKRAGPSKRKDNGYRVGGEVGPSRRAAEHRPREPQPVSGRGGQHYQLPHPYAPPHPRSDVNESDPGPIVPLPPQGRVFASIPPKAYSKGKKKSNKYASKSMEDTLDVPTTVEWPSLDEFKRRERVQADLLLPLEEFVDVDEEDHFLEEKVEHQWARTGGRLPTLEDVQSEILGQSTPHFTTTEWWDGQQNLDLPSHFKAAPLTEAQRIARGQEDDFDYFMSGAGFREESDEDASNERLTKGQRKAQRQGRFSRGFIQSDSPTVVVPPPKGKHEWRDVNNDLSPRELKENRAFNDHLSRYIRHRAWSITRHWMTSPGRRPHPGYPSRDTIKNASPGPNATTGWRRDNGALGFLHRSLLVGADDIVHVGRDAQLMVDYFRTHGNADNTFTAPRNKRWPPRGFPDVPNDWERAMTVLEHATTNDNLHELVVMLRAFRYTAWMTAPNMRDRSMVYAIADTARWERINDRYQHSYSTLGWMNYDLKLPQPNRPGQTMRQFYETALFIGFPTAQQTIPGIVVDLGMRLYAGALVPAYISQATSPRGDDAANTVAARRQYQLLFGALVAVPGRAQTLINEHNHGLSADDANRVGTVGPTRELSTFPFAEMNSIDELAIVRHLLRCGISPSTLDSFYVYGVNWLHDSIGRAANQDVRSELLDVEERRLAALRSLGGTVFPTPLPEFDFWIIPSRDDIIITMYWVNRESRSHSPGTMGSLPNPDNAQDPIPRALVDRFTCRTFAQQPSHGYWWPRGISPVRNRADWMHVASEEDPPILYSVVHHSDGVMLADDVQLVLSRAPYLSGTHGWRIAAHVPAGVSSTPATQPHTAGVTMDPTADDIPSLDPAELPDRDTDVSMAAPFPDGYSAPSVHLPIPLPEEDTPMDDASQVPLPTSNDDDIEEGMES